MSVSKKLLCGATAAAALCVGNACLAQTSDGSAAPGAAKSNAVSQLVVTAQRADAQAALTATKTDVPTLETPLNVQVVTAQTLQDQAVVSLDQAIRNVSGVTVGAGGGADNGQPFSSISLRGFPSDAHFRDGIRLDSFGSDSGTEAAQFANVDSVTVLKGASAMLYGMVEPGGIVNIVTKQPQAAAAYSIEQQVGSYDLYRTVLNATGPVNADKTLLYRVDASYEDAGSPTQFVYNHTAFIAPTIAWTPDTKDRVQLQLEYRDLNFGQNFGFEPLVNGTYLQPRIGVNYGERSPAREQTFLGDVSWSHQFNDAWSLRDQTLFNTILQHSDGIFPFVIEEDAPTPSGVAVGRFVNRIHGDDYTIAEDLDLQGHFATGPAQHTLLIGALLERFHYSGGILQEGQLDSDLSYVDAYNPIHPGTGFTGPMTPLIIDTQGTNTADVYLQDQIKLPHGLHLLGGISYQYVDTDSTLGFAGATPAPNPTLNAGRATPRVGALWQPQSWLSVYANYAENFGPSNGALMTNGQVVPPTSARQWEAGVKTTLLGQRLTASLDYFDLTKTNLPTPDPLNPGFELVIGEARSRGVEMDIQGRVTAAWNIVANYAYDDARVTKSSLADSNPPGSPLGEVPRNLAHLWTTYEFQSGSLKGLKIGGGATYHGSEPYLFYGGLTPPSIPDWQTFDLMAAYGFQVAGKHVTAQINATNILDRRYFTDIQAPGFPTSGSYSSVTALFGQPRTVIGSLKVDF